MLWGMQVEQIMWHQELLSGTPALVIQYRVLLKPLFLSALLTQQCTLLNSRAMFNVSTPQAWRVSEKLGLIGPACEQPEYNIFARKKVEVEFKPIYEK